MTAKHWNIIISTCMLLSWPLMAGTGNYALTIGISYYANVESLPYAQKNATDISACFSKQLDYPGNNILTMTDLDDGTRLFPTRENMLENINDMFKQVKPGGALFLTFVGHTAVDKDQLYLVPADGQPGDLETLISLKQLNEMAVKARIKKLLFVINTTLPGQLKSFSPVYPTLVTATQNDFGAQFNLALIGGVALSAGKQLKPALTPAEIKQFFQNKDSQKVLYFAGKQDCFSLLNYDMISNKALPYHQYVLLKSLWRKAMKLGTNPLFESSVRDLDRKRLKLSKQLKSGKFPASFKELPVLIKAYHNLFELKDIFERAKRTQAEAEKAEKLARKQKVTQKYASGFASAFVNQQQALAFLKSGEFQKAQSLYHKVTLNYQTLSYTALKATFDNTLEHYDRELLAKSAKHSWESIVRLLEAAEGAVKKNNFEQAIACYQAAERKLPDVLKSATQSLLNSAAKFNTPQDYKTALYFIDKVLALNPRHETAIMLKHNILANSRFKAGERFTDESGITFVFVPAGIFTMGSVDVENSRDRDEAQYQVTLPYGFFIAETETTQQQWDTVMGKDYKPAQGIHPNDLEKISTRDKSYPRNCVNWHEANAFCKALSKRTKRRYRLPTEAEWEYACRAGTKAAFSNGRADLNSKDANVYDDLNPRMDLTKVATVGKPNQFNLYDMHGNVWEWCSDWYGPYAKKSAINPQGPERALAGNGESTKVLRGGSWYDDASAARSANRWESLPTVSSSYIGFRVVLDPATVEEPVKFANK